MSAKFEPELSRRIQERPWRLYTAVVLLVAVVVAAVVLIGIPATRTTGRKLLCRPGQPVYIEVSIGRYTSMMCPPEGYVVIAPEPASPCSPENALATLERADPALTVVPVGPFNLTKCAYESYAYSTATSTLTSTPTSTATDTLTPEPTNTRKPKEPADGGCGPNGCPP
jgi:hypothetical protein